MEELIRRYSNFTPHTPGVATTNGEVVVGKIGKRKLCQLANMFLDSHWCNRISRSPCSCTARVKRQCQVCLLSRARNFTRSSREQGVFNTIGKANIRRVLPQQNHLSSLGTQPRRSWFGPPDSGNTSELPDEGPSLCMGCELQPGCPKL